MQLLGRSQTIHVAQQLEKQQQQRSPNQAVTALFNLPMGRIRGQFQLQFERSVSWSSRAVVAVAIVLVVAVALVVMFI
jgi:anti-sigma-K factor RskA